MQGIGVDVEDHVGDMVLNFGIVMCQHVVKELVGLLLGFFSRCSLLCGNLRKGQQDGGIDSSCII